MQAVKLQDHHGPGCEKHDGHGEKDTCSASLRANAYAFLVQGVERKSHTGEQERKSYQGKCQWHWHVAVLTHWIWIRESKHVSSLAFFGCYQSESFP